jgi:hypothetical protein
VAIEKSVQGKQVTFSYLNKQFGNCCLEEKALIKMVSTHEVCAL